MKIYMTLGRPEKNMLAPFIAWNSPFKAIILSFNVWNLDQNKQMKKQTICLWPICVFFASNANKEIIFGLRW